MLFSSRLFKNPRIQIIFLLSLFFLFTIWHFSLINGIYLLILCLGFTVGSDLLLFYLRNKKLFEPYSAIITGLILTLIIDPTISWYQIFAIAFAAMAIKNFLRINGKHIFNPAASGLIAGWAFFNINAAWWGPSPYTAGNIFTLPNLAILASVLSLAYVSCYRYKRYNTVLTFLISFTILSALFSSSLNLKSIISFILAPGILFYALVMVPEPMTSPMGRKKQVFYGLTVAVINVLLIYIIQNFIPNLGINLPDFSLLALLLGNLIFFKFR